MSALSARLRSLGILVCLLGATVGLSGCGKSNHPVSTENDGVYITAGPITYQLQISRQLNPFGTEDRQYITGVPAAEASLSPTQEWYGVFLWAKNQTQHPQPTSNNFVIVDSSGGRYYPLHLDTTINSYAWTQQVLAPSAIEPAPNTTASEGPTQGGLVLFKLPTAVYSNRPLTLQIYPSGGGKPGQISLDL